MLAHAPRPYGINRRSLAVIALGCVAAALVGPLVATSPTMTYGIAAILGLTGVLALSARQPVGAVLVVSVVVVSALNDVPQRLHVGPTTGQGVETLALVTVMVLVCLNGYAAIGVDDRGRLWPLALFVMWSVASFTWGGVTQEGIQNVAVYASFLGMLVIGATVGRWRPTATYEATKVAFRVAAFLGLGLYAISYVLEGSHTRLIVSPRPFALFGVILVAWFTAAHLNGSRGAKWVVAATLLLTTLSLSRSALAAQLVVIALGYLGSTQNFRTVVRTTLAIGLVALIALSAFVLYAPLRDRFSSGDVQNVGGISLNVMGRDAIWSKNWQWYLDKPIIGWGAGSSDNMTASLPPSPLGTVIGHPHNDYLRILVDFGSVGLLVWIVAYFRLIATAWRQWRERMNSHTPATHVCCAALLGLIGIAVTMLVDNPLIEVVKMAPLGALVGMALGMASAESAEFARRVGTAAPSARAAQPTI